MKSTFDLESARLEIVNAIRRSSPAWLGDQAEDLAQAVLLRIVERHTGGEGIEVREPSYWRRAAHNALVDEIRRFRARREERLETAEHASPPDERPQMNPGRAAANQELGRAIESCLGTIREGRHLPVVLYLQGHSVPQSSAILGWAVKKTDSALHRGLQDLRRCLERKGFSR